MSLEAIKAKLLEQATKGRREGGNTSSTGGDNASYAFWNIPEGNSATVRFLPDGDTDNTFFWVRREVIRLPFEGVVGGENPTDRQVTVTVPCVDMFGMACPIMAETRPWWKDPAKEGLARQYWKKKSYIFQGFVVQSPFEEQNVPENPIRRFVINPSIYEIIEKSLMNPEMEDMPTDYVGGRDFKITKTRKGEYANYSTSSWSFRTRSLGVEELEAVERFGLFNLKDYLGRKPDTEELEVIKDMFHASLRGDPFDVAAYGKWFRPYGSREDSGVAVTRAASSTPAPAAPRAAASVVEEASVVRETVAVAAAPAAEPVAAASSGGKPSAAEILERIKNRASR